jgi:SAM-dependent methyltransferase
MALAVGGEYERFGVPEHAVLREHAGLQPQSSVTDVGCGSGRLAAQLARVEGIGYLGTDIVATLLDYARRRAGRPDFRFIHVDRVGIPAPDASVDIVCFFSVLTHLLHEESFAYLREAHRVLKPGGRVAFSFLEYDTPTGWTVFEANLDWVRTRVIASQINVFLPRPVIRLWARRLGFEIVVLRDGEQGAVTVGPGEAIGAVPEGPQAFGQSICVLRKPLPGEAPKPYRPRTGPEDERTASERPAWRRAEQAESKARRDDRAGDAAKAVSRGDDVMDETGASGRPSDPGAASEQERLHAKPHPKASDH